MVGSLGVMQIKVRSGMGNDGAVKMVEIDNRLGILDPWVKGHTLLRVESGGCLY